MTKKIQKKTYGAVSLVLGILSLVLLLMPYFGLPLAILAVIFAGKSIRNKEMSLNATAGKICGIIGIVVSGMILLFLGLTILIGLI
jgi:TRAP-type mannitol/chloroaromatic compound transport system permease small subunit